MASIWEGSGRVWGVSWALLGALGLFFRRSKTYFFKALVQDGLQEAFWIDFGWLLERFGGRFGEDLGGFLPIWGWILKRSGKESGRELKDLGRAGAESLQLETKLTSNNAKKNKHFRSIWAEQIMFSLESGWGLGSIFGRCLLKK